MLGTRQERKRCRGVRDEHFPAASIRKPYSAFGFADSFAADCSGAAPLW